MAKVTYITQDGNKVEVDNAEGNLMEIALDNAVEGIDGSCGGVCSCSTCHVYIPEAWKAKVGPGNDDEEAVLSSNEFNTDRSRLGCQIEMNEDLDGLVVEVAPSY